EKLHAPVVYAGFEGVRSGADRDAIAKLIQTILIETVTAIRLSQSIGAGDVHARNASFARRERPVVVVDDVEILNPELGNVEICVGAGIERVVAGGYVAHAELVNDGRRKDVYPATGIVMVPRNHLVAELWI